MPGNFLGRLSNLKWLLLRPVTELSFMEHHLVLSLSCIYDFRISGLFYFFNITKPRSFWGFLYLKTPLLNCIYPPFFTDYWLTCQRCGVWKVLTFTIWNHCTTVFQQPILLRRRQILACSITWLLFCFDSLFLCSLWKPSALFFSSSMHSTSINVPVERLFGVGVGFSN